ncbi:MAG: two-component sensor histidine kinase, partial [uncultured Acidimicrobiales bacterium]
DHDGGAALAGHVREGQRVRAARPDRARVGDRLRSGGRALDAEPAGGVLVGPARGPHRPGAHRRPRGDAAGSDGRTRPMGGRLPRLGRARGLPGDGPSGGEWPRAACPGPGPQALDGRLGPLRRPPHRGGVPHGADHRVRRAAARRPCRSRDTRSRARPRAEQPCRCGSAGRGLARRRVRSAPVGTRHPGGERHGGAAARPRRTPPRDRRWSGRGRSGPDAPAGPGGGPLRLARRARRPGRLVARPATGERRGRRGLVRAGRRRAGRVPGSRHGVGGQHVERPDPAGGGEGGHRPHLEPGRGGQVLLPDGPRLAPADGGERRAREHAGGAEAPPPR